MSKFKLLIFGALLLTLVGCSVVPLGSDRSTDLVIDGIRIGVSAGYRLYHPRHKVVTVYYVSAEGYVGINLPPRPVFKEAAIKAIEIHTGCKVSTVEFWPGSGSFVDATVKCSEK